MEPAFQRGDLLFLTLTEDPIRVGDICVFKIKGKEIPIVHRVIELHDQYVFRSLGVVILINSARSGKQYILTKGDNNQVDDRGLYNPGQMWINREDVVGRVKG